MSDMTNTGEFQGIITVKVTFILSINLKPVLTIFWVLTDLFFCISFDNVKYILIWYGIVILMLIKRFRGINPVLYFPGWERYFGL